MGPDPTLAVRMLALAVVVVAILVATVFLLHTLRRGSYHRWPFPLRATFLLLVTGLCVMGAGAWLHAWSLVWGWPATIWLVSAPVIYGLLNHWQRTGQPTARPE